MANSFTIIEQGQSLEVQATVSGDSVRLTPEALSDGFGWELKQEGLCRGEVCVPIRDRDALVIDGGVDLSAFATALGRPLALDAAEGVAAIGTPATDLASQLNTLEAPDFTLPDLEGKLHSLSEHRGKKVLLIAYASW